MAQVDDAESVAFGIGEHNEVRIVRISIPIDALSTERDEARDFARLLRCRVDVQIKVDSRVGFGRGSALLKSEHRPSTGRWHEHC